MSFLWGLLRSCFQTADSSGESSSSRSCGTCDCGAEHKGDMSNDATEERNYDSETSIFRTIGVGMLSCNCCIIGNPETKQAIVVDPGGDGKRICQLIDKLELRVVQIIITHGHFDHFMAAQQVKKHTGAIIYLHRADLIMWRNVALQLQMVGYPPAVAQKLRIPDPDSFLDEDDELVIFNGRVLHTPGHSQGSISLYFEPLNIVCAGDTLFKGNVGRTDLHGGDSSSIKQSIKKKLYSLPDETIVIAGHGPSTTIGREKKSNSVVRA